MKILELLEQLITYYNLLEKLVDQEEIVLLSAAYSALRYAVLKGNAAMGLDQYLSYR